MTWTGHIACIRRMRNPNKILVGEPERKRPFGTHRRRWEANSRMDLRGIG